MSRRSAGLIGLLLGVLVLACVLTWFLVGGGDDEGPLSQQDASEADIVQSWADAACGSAPIQDGDPPSGDAMSVHYCDPGTQGSPLERRAYLTVYRSEAGVQTRSSQKDCSSPYIAVSGPTWYAESALPEVATALQEAGGQLVC